MLPAETLPKLKRRIDDYLWREDATPIRRLRNILANRFLPLGRTAIIGGFVRDMARKGKVGFRSDIDLVVDAPPDAIAALAVSMHATPNRFGGFSSAHPGWKIDFWSLPNTWAAAVGLVQVSDLADLVHTTFFDCDAICYEIQDRRLHAISGYLERIANRTIDVNLLPNPSIDGNLLRAARRILLWGFAPGAALRGFIERELNEQSFERIVTAERLLHANTVLNTFSSVCELRRALLDNGATAMFLAFSEQLDLPGLDDQ